VPDLSRPAANRHQSRAAPLFRRDLGDPVPRKRVIELRGLQGALLESAVPG
jgi:hypothetical protein